MWDKEKEKEKLIALPNQMFLESPSFKIAEANGVFIYIYMQTMDERYGVKYSVKTLKDIHKLLVFDNFSFAHISIFHHLL